MRSNPFTTTPPRTISYQIEEQCIPVGCCFSNTRNLMQPLRPPTILQSRVHSQPKTPKHKKIDLVINKRGLSNPKDHIPEKQRQSSSQKHKKGITTHQKDREPLRLGPSALSKLDSQKTSMKASKVIFNKDYKLQLPQSQPKQSWMTTRNTTKQFYTEGNNLPSTEHQTSIALISDISRRDEQFISHGSQTLQALNFIAQIKYLENKPNQKPISGERIKTQRMRKVENQWQHFNPFSRKQQPKGKGTPERHKRLLL